MIMKKRVFIVHGWDSKPSDGWFPWLKRELESRGFEVNVPALPESGTPHIRAWVPALAVAVVTPDEHTYFVGHSIGCQTIARYVASLPDGVSVGGAVFVAGFIKRLSGLEDDAEVHEIADEWLLTPLDLDRVRSHIGKSVAIFSDDDPYVPLDNQDDFRDKLGSEIVIEHGRGHFSGQSDGVTELPIVLESLLTIV